MTSATCTESNGTHQSLNNGCGNDKTMSFHLSRAVTGCKARLGRLDSVRNGITKQLETPGMLTFTRCGVVPYLTMDLAKDLPFDVLSFTCGPLNGLIQSQETLESSVSDGIRDMLGVKCALKPHFFLSTISDSMGGSMPGLNQKDAVSVFCVGGKVMVSLKEQLKLLGSVKADAFQILCDGDTDRVCPKKRLEKSYSRSVSFLNDTFTSLSGDSENLAGTSAFASLIGGYNVQMRSKFASEVQKVDNLVAGYVIDSLHYGGDSSLDVSVNFGSDEFVQLFEASLAPLSCDKPRFLPGCFTPAQMAAAVVHLGVDLFDSSYAYYLTEQGKALVFNKSSSSSTPVVDMDKLCSILDFKAEKSSLMSDFSVIDGSCPCYACTKPFTRAYLCHLVAVEEILGQILLMIHNLTSLHMFLSSLREALQKIS